MFPDIKTIFLSYVFTGLVCTIFMVFLWYRNRRRFSGIFLWIVNSASQVLSLILLLLRGVLPDFLSIVAANCFMAFGVMVLLFGLERFLGKKVSWKHNIIFLATFVLAHAYLTYIQPDLQARVINLSLMMLLLTVQCGWLLARRVDSVMQPITRGTAIVMGFYSGIAVFRIIHALSWANAKQNLFHTGVFDASLILAYNMLFIGLTYSLAMMVNRRLTQEVKTQEERFRSIVELSADWHYWIGPDGTLLYTSPSCERFTGYGPQDFISEAELRKKIVHPDDKDLVRDHSDAVSKNRETQSIDCRIVTRTGETRWINHVCQPVYDLENRWLGRVVSNRDITRRKQMEQQLVKAREDWEGIFHATGDFTLILSPEREIQAVNQMGEKLLGRQARELVGKRCYEVFHQSAAPPAGCSFSAVKGNSAVTSAEMMMEALDRIFMVSCTPVLDADGSVEKIIHVATDITERKGMEAEREKLQLQFLQAQKMESVGRLAGGVAHDFNNMLGVILGRAELALMDMAPGDPFHEDFKEIEKTARRSADLTRQLLAFARKQTISPRVLNLNVTVEQMLKMLRSLIGEDIELIWVPHSNLWPVRMDPAQVDQVLANLCVNARDAISGVGKISIKTKNAVLDQVHCVARTECVPGEYVMVDVSDDGGGMTEEVISNMFEPFFTTKAVGEGTGLGLSTVYGIVKQNGGCIDISSEPGQGATFRIYIPRYMGGPVKRVTEAPAEVPRGSGETVLLVEDDSGILELSGAMLERLGYKTLKTNSPNDALERAQSESGKFHLLMTDVVMPGMNGKDLAERLSEMQPGMKVLFMSGYTADIIAHKGILNKETHFIQKPFTMTALAQGVREALTGREET